MAITYSISPNPHWVVIDNFSKLPVGAVIYTFSSENPSLPKTAYADAGGTAPFGEYIQGFANGTFPPIFWAFDSDFPSDLYYIQVWDKVKVPGGDAVMLWDFSGISGGGSGGGGVITNNLDLENLVINGQFFNNIGNLPIAPATSVDTLVTLAPSNHDGFIGTGAVLKGPIGPDIIFAKENQTATDSLSFVDFPKGANEFGATPTPKQFVRYISDNAGNEQYKFIQWPIVKGLQNLNDEIISVQMWNRLNGGSSNISLYLRQFFGNGGGASADVETFIASLNFVGANWSRTLANSVLVPSIAGKVLGTCGNDALYFQIRFPASEAVNMDFILPAIYLGSQTSTVDFHTQDEVNSITMSPRTGDIRTSINSFYPYGWVPMNDGTIGSLTSGATTRANVDTFPLYSLIWNSVSDALAPVVGGRGASAIDDFVANKAISLTRNLGRVMAGALPVAASQAFVRAANTLVVTSTAGFYTGMAVTVNVTGGGLTSGVIYYAIVLNSTTLSLATTTANALAGTVIVLGAVPNGTITSVNVETLGSYIGEERHLQLTAEVGSHTHPTHTWVIGGAAQPALNTVVNATNAGSDSTVVDVLANSGGTPFNIIQPTVYMNVMIKL